MSRDLFSAAVEADLRRAEARRAGGSGAPPAAGPSAAPQEWTPSRVNAALRRMVEGSFPPIWVVGEITGFTRARSGHCYFTLRDDTSQVRCVMWRDDARRLPTTPEEGMEVRAFGRLSLYEARGEFQLIVTALEAKGEGLWKLAMERLRLKLEAEGLTSAARKRTLPRCPAAVGIVTSASGAVLHDISTVVRRRAPWTRLVLCSCRVQGEGAADEIARAIRLFGRARCVDVLIVARGGGSVEDLWAFNQEIVARAIAASPVPTISAIGHETDVTIADLVADFRAPTPSAAAEAAVLDGADIVRELRRVSERMPIAVEKRIAAGWAATAAARDRLATAGERMVARRRERLTAAGQRLHALSPLSALGRGYALPVRRDGEVLRQRSEFQTGADFDLLVQDGRVPCRVADRPTFEEEADAARAGGTEETAGATAPEEPEPSEELRLL